MVVVGTGGCVFLPISLENEQTGWSTFWTVTPSAINSWIGSELRTIGAEGTLQWRRNGGTVTVIGALFGDNDPAGILISFRGWSFDDRVTGLFEKTRLPNAMAAILHQPVPLERNLFQEIDLRRAGTSIFRGSLARRPVSRSCATTMTPIRRVGAATSLPGTRHSGISAFASRLDR